MKRLALGALITAAAIAAFLYLIPAPAAPMGPGSDSGSRDNAMAASQAATRPQPAKASGPARPPGYPRTQHSIPEAFRGNWDEIVDDGCRAREARFFFGEEAFMHFEVRYGVKSVRLNGPDEMDLTVTFVDDDGAEEDEIWSFQLVDGGRTLVVRSAGDIRFSRCPR